MFDSVRMRYGKAFNIFVFTCFSIAILIVLAALIRSENGSNLISILLGIAVMTYLVIIILVLFIHFYKRYASKNSLTENLNFREIIKDLAACSLVIFILSILLYIFLVAYTVACDITIGFNGVIATEVNGFITSLRETPLSGLIYILNTFIKILFGIVLILFSCIFAGSEFFRLFKILAAIFLIVMLFVFELFAVNFVMSLILSGLGGIETIFMVHPDSAVAIVLLLESLVYLIFITIKLCLIKIYSRSKLKRGMATLAGIRS